MAVDSEDLIGAVAELRKAHKHYDLAEEYFEGTREEFFADPVYKQALQRTGTTFRMNFAKTAVDTVVERLEINGIVATTPAETAMMEGLWEENQMDLEASEIHNRACEFGDAYAIVWPDESIVEEDDNELGEDDELPQIGVEIYYNDPRTIRVFYDKENPRRKEFALKLWQIGANHTLRYRANLYYPDRIEKYVTNRNANGDNPGDWGEWDDDSGVWPTPNPYGEIPVFHFRTSRPYGMPQHKYAYGPQDIITKTVITHMNTMDYHGFPQRYALMGGDLADGDTDTEDFGYSDEEIINPELERPDSRSQLSAKPGHMWMLKNIKGVGEFQAAQPNVFLDPLKVYIGAMAQLTTTPMHRFDESGNPPSGELLRVAEAPFIKKVKRIQLSFGATWNELLAFSLKMIKQQGSAYEAYVRNLTNESSGGSGDPNAGSVLDAISGTFGSGGRVKVIWENPTTKDDRIEWDLAILKRDAGVPIRQILLDAGYTTKQLDLWGVPEAKYIAPPPPAPVASLPPLRVNPNQSIQKVE